MPGWAGLWPNGPCEMGLLDCMKKTGGLAGPAGPSLRKKKKTARTGFEFRKYFLFQFFYKMQILLNTNLI
jgi:hypothetical protein